MALHLGFDRSCKYYYYISEVKFRNPDFYIQDYFVGVDVLISEPLFTVPRHTQEADSPNRSTPMPKVVVGVPRVLKVFSWVFIYKVHKKIGLGPKKSVKPG